MEGAAMAWRRQGKEPSRTDTQRQRKATAMRRNSFMLDFAYKQKGVIFMKGLVFDTENRLRLKDFGEPLLDSLQKEVGGYIEVVHPKYLPEGLCMVVDDEGLLKGSAINNIASVIYGTPEHGQPIVGNAVILREGFVNGERDFVSLNDDDEAGLIVLLSLLHFNVRINVVDDPVSIKDESETE